MPFWHPAFLSQAESYAEKENASGMLEAFGGQNATRSGLLSRLSFGGLNCLGPIHPLLEVHFRLRANGDWQHVSLG